MRVFGISSLFDKSNITFQENLATFRTLENFILSARLSGQRETFYAVGNSELTRWHPLDDQANSTTSYRFRKCFHNDVIILFNFFRDNGAKFE